MNSWLKKTQDKGQEENEIDEVDLEGELIDAPEDSSLILLRKKLKEAKNIENTLLE